MTSKKLSIEELKEIVKTAKETFDIAYINNKLKWCLFDGENAVEYGYKTEEEAVERLEYIYLNISK